MQDQSEFSSLPCREQRQSHRFPVVGERRESLIETAGQLRQARIVNESASGLRVIVSGRLMVVPSTVARLYLDDLWIPVEVIRAEVDGDETIIGFRRLKVTLTPTCLAFFLIQMQGCADVRPIQNSPEVLSLVRGFEKWLIAVNRRIGPVGDIIDRANRVGCHFADALNVFSCEKQTLRVDVTVVDEPFGLL